jgi:hypothetical protein
MLKLSIAVIIGGQPPHGGIIEEKFGKVTPFVVRRPRHGGRLIHRQTLPGHGRRRQPNGVRRS